ncbi:MAG: dienelactone hydrolase [Sandarakinorhabdus sp.]|nr:dienelactone hydrolase [Sandarakinorhabdus sp.]
MRHFLLILLALGAAPVAARPPSLVPADAPELAAPGALPVGVRSVRFDAAPGRNLEMRIWYPAARPGPATTYSHSLAFTPKGIPDPFVWDGIATADAAPAKGEKLPLLVFSHGLNRWSTAMSGMAENLASKGYVVASIDHDDRLASNPATALQAFGIAFARRSADQRAAIDWLTDFARSKDPLATRIDAANIGLVGYSMGGFGVLATAGAGYDPKGPVMAQMPPGSAPAAASGVPAVRAAVLIAPWGGADKVRSFTAAGDAAMTVPSLWIMGDADDIAGAAGIRWLFDNAVNSDRHLLVFANARHNLGGNPPPPGAPDTGVLRDWMDEPVWRKDMADAIVYRSLTAFFDLTLKGEAAKAAWLDVDADGKLKGFQKRWQLGLTATHTPAR